MTQGNGLISKELLQQFEKTALAQNRKVAEVIDDALRSYLQGQELLQFVMKNERRARALGLTEEDIPRLIEEVRREEAERLR